MLSPFSSGTHSFFVAVTLTVILLFGSCDDAFVLCMWARLLTIDVCASGELTTHSTSALEDGFNTLLVEIRKDTMSTFWSNKIWWLRLRSQAPELNVEEAAQDPELERKPVQVGAPTEKVTGELTDKHRDAFENVLKLQEEVSQLFERINRRKLRLSEMQTARFDLDAESRVLTGGEERFVVDHIETYGRRLKNISNVYAEDGKVECVRFGQDGAHSASADQSAPPEAWTGRCCVSRELTSQSPEAPIDRLKNELATIGDEIYNPGLCRDELLSTRIKRLQWLKENFEEQRTELCSQLDRRERDLAAEGENVRNIFREHRMNLKNEVLKDRNTCAVSCGTTVNRDLAANNACRQQKKAHSDQERNVENGIAIFRRALSGQLEAERLRSKEPEAAAGDQKQNESTAASSVAR